MRKYTKQRPHNLYPVDAQEVDGMTQKTGALALLTCERTLRALELRKQGCTYVAIGAELGVTPQAVHRRVSKALSKLYEEVEEEVKLIRRLEAERLDALQSVCWTLAMEGNLLAVDRVLRIMDRRARLFGLEKSPESNLPSFSEVAARVQRVLGGYTDPMPPEDDDGTTDPEWWEPISLTLSTNEIVEGSTLEQAA